MWGFILDLVRGKEPEVRGGGDGQGGGNSCHMCGGVIHIFC
jgi:hypothetical protein